MYRQPEGEEVGSTIYQEQVINRIKIDWLKSIRILLSTKIRWRVALKEAALYLREGQEIHTEGEVVLFLLIPQLFSVKAYSTLEERSHVISLRKIMLEESVPFRKERHCYRISNEAESKDLFHKLPDLLRQVQVGWYFSHQFHLENKLFCGNESSLSVLKTKITF